MKKFIIVHLIIAILSMFLAITNYYVYTVNNRWYSLFATVWCFALVVWNLWSVKKIMEE